VKKAKAAPPGIGQTQLRIDVPTEVAEFFDRLAERMARNGLVDSVQPPAQRRESTLNMALSLGMIELVYANYRQEHGDEALEELLAECPNGNPMATWAMDLALKKGKLN